MSKTGQCLCGAVHYRIDAEPMGTAICHCRHCQRQAGSAFSVVVIVAADAVQIDGELTAYDDIADSGRTMARKFCPKCGSPILSHIVDIPQIMFIKAGTLDEIETLEPQMQIWCKSAQPWLELDRNLLRYEENPPLPV